MTGSVDISLAVRHRARLFQRESRFRVPQTTFGQPRRAGVGARFAAAHAHATLRRSHGRVRPWRQLGLTVSIVTVLTAPLLCDVTARPSRSVDPRVIVNVEPGMRVQVTPSAEV